MSVRDSKTIRVSNDFISILDRLADEFKISHNISLSYSEISKAIANKLNKLNFLLTKNDKDNIIDNNINIKFIEHKINIDNKMDAEHYATGFFKDKGYNIKFSKKMNSLEKKNPDKIAVLYDMYPNLKECIKDQLGIPDLVAFKNDKFVFIEVKTNGDGLKKEQLKWMMKHSNVEIILFYLTQNILKT